MDTLSVLGGIQEWYLLDSERPGPLRLNTTSWRQLKGTVSIFARGSAYNYSVIPGAKEEGYIQCLHALEFLTPDELDIVTQATRRPRHAQQPNVGPSSRRGHGREWICMRASTSKRPC